MKNTLTAFWACIILLSLCTSCFKEADFGFPDIAIFSGDGGTKTVTGNTTFTHAEIHNYKTGEAGNVTMEEDGTECNEYKWLKIKYKRHSEKLTIYADPNTTGKSRKLYIEIYSGPKYAVIKVVQN